VSVNSLVNILFDNRSYVLLTHHARLQRSVPCAKRDSYLVSEITSSIIRSHHITLLL